MALAGVAVLIALLIAYLSDCIPGLGSGVQPGESSPSAASSKEVESKAADARLVITVQGDRCREGEGAATSCAELCAGLDRTQAATLDVDVEATEGRHGVVEELRECLKQAGFTKVRVHAE